MAIYNEPERSPRATNPECEICEGVAAVRVHRIVSNGVRVAFRAHAQNRRRVGLYYAQRASRPETAGKKACPTCYTAILDAVNATYGPRREGLNNASEV